MPVGLSPARAQPFKSESVAEKMVSETFFDRGRSRPLQVVPVVRLLNASPSSLTPVFKICRKPIAGSAHR